MVFLLLVCLHFFNLNDKYRYCCLNYNFELPQCLHIHDKYTKLISVFLKISPNSSWNSQGSLYSSLAHASLSRTKERVWSNCILRYVTAEDKPINTPRISWQACTKVVCSLTRLSPLRESLACARLLYRHSDLGLSNDLGTESQTSR